MTVLRNAALEYADRGWHVLPLQPGQKRPMGGLVPNGKDNATNDLATVLRWWTDCPNANIGLSCAPSGLVIVDIDPRNGGDETFARLERELGRLPRTVTAETGGGGRHFLFRHPGEQLLGKAGHGVDIKSAGYCVLPPSSHPSGDSYRWSVAPADAELSELPTAWLEALRNLPTARPQASLRTGKDPIRSIPAAEYFSALTGRQANRRGMVQCPFHKDGTESTPSLKVDGHIWSCYACPPPAGKQFLGGNIYDLAGLLLGYPIPLASTDFARVKVYLNEKLSS